MADKNEIYIAIDLKSFYASVECMDRGLDPLKTHLVVADASKTEKTICLAVTPSLKKLGVSGRARLYEVVAQVKKANAMRLARVGAFEGKSANEDELLENGRLEIDYIAAPPRMAHYLEYSTRIYEIYLKYVADEDIHVYSIDEVFIDATKYLKAHKMRAKEFAKMIIKDIVDSTGITATAGIGTNMYLAKVAMDIVAKHIKADDEGVRIAILDEKRYRHFLWDHLPITDFWRVGKGYEKRLKEIGLFTMGDIARCSLGGEGQYHNEELLYKTFGVNAELLIDHAWGYEPTTIAEIKAYKPQKKSVGMGQVLLHPYSFESGRVVICEMLDALALDLFDKKLLTNQIVITAGYDIENIAQGFKGEITTDVYGRKIPKQSRGTVNLRDYTSSARIIRSAVLEWFDEVVHKDLSLRRFNVTAGHVIGEDEYESQSTQMDFFDMVADEQSEAEKIMFEKEKRLQEATLSIKKKYGKNALLKGLNLKDDATAKSRNDSIGGHKA